MTKKSHSRTALPAAALLLYILALLTMTAACLGDAPEDEPTTEEQLEQLNQRFLFLEEVLHEAEATRDAYEAQKQDAPTPAPLQAGAPAESPITAMQGLSEEQQTLESLFGPNPLVVHFWEPSHPRALEQLTLMQELHQRVSPAVTVLTLLADPSQDAATSQEALSLLQQAGATAPAAYTPDETTAANHAVATRPTTIFFQPGGTEMNRWTGPIDRASLDILTDSLAGPKTESTQAADKQTPGICQRTPTFQNAILATLQAPSCAAVTPDELFRITRFSLEPNYRQIQPGDLEGLVNLQSVEIEANGRTIPAGAFAGAQINSVHISDADLAPMAFQDARITSIHLKRTTPQQAAFDGLQGLLHLYISGLFQFPEVNIPDLSQLRTLSVSAVEFPVLETNHLDNLPHLTSLTLEGYLYPHAHPDRVPTGNQPGRTYSMDPQALVANEALESVTIKVAGHPNVDANYRLVIPKELLAHLASLESVSIGNRVHMQDHILGHPPLNLSSVSPLYKHMRPPETLPQDWLTSERKQQQDAWRAWANGDPIAAAVPGQ